MRAVQMTMILSGPGGPRSHDRSSCAFAAGDEVWVAEAELAVEQGAAVGGHDLAARRLEHALARCGVPFVGRAEARINVGLALGDQAELQRRAGLDALGYGKPVVAEPDVEVAVDRVAAARARDQPFRRRLARPDRRKGAAALALVGAELAIAAPHRVGRGCQHDAKRRLAVLDQRDIDRELAVPLD